MLFRSIDFKKYEGDVYLIFGKESTGVDRHILANHLELTFRIPTTDKIRSLNLSNCVAIVAFEYLRQFDYFDLERHEPETLKGKDFLDDFL